MPRVLPPLACATALLLLACGPSTGQAPAENPGVPGTTAVDSTAGGPTAGKAVAGETGVPAGVDDLPLTWMPTDPAARVAVLTGRLRPAEDPAFVRLADRYTDADGDYLVRRETAAALTRMIDSAAADGVTLTVRSATRNFERQAQIWGAKWRGDRLLEGGLNLAESGLSDSAKARKILLYSSMPGTSRHHWGTDVDLNAFENDYFDVDPGAAEYAWLAAHAPTFGFYQPYTDKAGGRTGYEEERWHWSYRPLSRPLTALYRAEVDYDDIRGFDGADQARAVGAIEEYVLGLPTALQPR